MKIDLKDYEHRELTGGINGYPTPVIGLALFADSLEALETLEEKTGGTICEVHWRDGWGNAASPNPIDPDSYRESVVNEFGRLARTVYTADEWEGVEAYVEAAREGFDEEEWAEYGEAFREQGDAINSILADDPQAVVTVDESGNVEDHGYCTQGYSHDIHNYRLAVVLDPDEWEVDWREKTATRVDSGEPEPAPPAGHTPEWFASSDGGQGLIYEDTGKPVAVTYDEKDAPRIVSCVNGWDRGELSYSPLTGKVTDHNGNLVATIHGNPLLGEWARSEDILRKVYLLAAGPDMLQALEEISRRIDAASGAPYFTAEEHDEIEGLIAKAKGES